MPLRGGYEDRAGKKSIGRVGGGWKTSLQSNSSKTGEAKKLKEAFRVSKVKDDRPSMSKQKEKE